MSSQHGRDDTIPQLNGLIENAFHSSTCVFRVCVRCAGVSCIWKHANVNTIYFERKEIE